MFLSKIKTLIYQGHIKFIKIDSKVTYDVTNDLGFKNVLRFSLKY